MKRLCLASRVSGIAGPASFQRRLAAGLEARGFAVSYGLSGDEVDAVLVTGGSRDLAGLRRAKRRGLPIVQRLDGMNWIHRRRRTGLRHTLRAEANNLLLRWVRSRLADTVVYQSDFVKRWWETSHGVAPGRSVVIRNGVPLDAFTPRGDREPVRAGSRLLVLEGAIGGGYEIGLTWAAELAAGLAAHGGARLPVELTIAGRKSRLPASFELAGSTPDIEIRWAGEAPPETVPTLLRSADLLFSADVNPACPNSVIEALACGLPVVAFDTGAIGEIVDRQSGAVVPYGGDPWKLERPDLEALTLAAGDVLNGGEVFRRGARQRAEASFGLDQMIDAYLAVLGWSE
jgi:glycosyltransferase involved in cell wall biosynthesis